MTHEVNFDFTDRFEILTEEELARVTGGIFLPMCYYNYEFEAMLATGGGLGYTRPGGGPLDPKK